MSSTKKGYTFGSLLKSLRELADLQQKDMLKKLNASKPTLHENTYRNWERGNNLPGLRDVQEIVRILQLEGIDQDDTDKLFTALSQTPPKLWTVPYIRNSLFTGRKRILQLLSEELTANQSVALCGLGGIGKTLIAVEYAYRYRDQYRTVLWVNADSPESLVSSYIALASRLNLPEKDVEKQDDIVEAVKYWLDTHIQWLLILDNADDVALTYDFLPSFLEQGHIIFTTRSQAHGSLAHSIKVDRMTVDASALFLLKRAKKIAPNTPLARAQEEEIANAKRVVEILGGLPLALDQAGAYIEETECSVMDYVARYEQERHKLLKRRNRLGKEEKEHPESVALTFSLCFEKVKQRNGAAVKLLQFCAFLSPDAIPEQLLLEGAPNIDPEMQSIADNPGVLDELVEVLCAYSLIQRNAKIKIFSIHRLVKAILQEEMGEIEQRQYTERVLYTIERIFPYPFEIKAWPLCQQYLLSALTCASLIEEKHIVLPEALSLLNKIGRYLIQRARFREAEPLVLHAVALYNQLMGQTEHGYQSIIMGTMQQLYRAQGKYEQAEQILLQELSLNERLLGPEHLDTIGCRNDLGVLYRDQGKYEQAILLLKQGLMMLEKMLDAGHPTIAECLDNLAVCYSEQEKYAEAERFNKRALSIWEQQPEPNNPDTATCLHNLGSLYVRQGMYSEAEPLLQRALEIRMQILEAEHPETAGSFYILAELYRRQGRYTDAEPLYMQALSIYEKLFDPGHPDMIPILMHLAALHSHQQKYSEAELVYKKALALCEQHKGKEHEDTANILSYLAVHYEAREAGAEAEALYQRALMICQKTLGAAHPKTIISTDNLATFYDAQGEYEKAELLYQYISEVLEQQNEQVPMDYYRNTILRSWVKHYAMQGKQKEIDQLLHKAFVIYRQQT